MRHQPLTIFFLLLTLSVFFSAFAFSNPIQDHTISRKWKYVDIKTEGGAPVKQVGDHDYFILNSDKAATFKYDLNVENVHAEGSWKLEDSTLILSYTNTESGNIRSYRIVELTNNKLVLAENDVFFAFSALPEPLQGSISMAAFGRGLIGLLVMLLILYAFSSNRKNIQWKLVGTGLLFQLIIAVGVLKVDLIKDLFEMFGQFFVVILNFTLEGSRFVLGDLVNPSGSLGFVFAFQILPTIIFFSALTSLLFYLGVLQKIVYALAWIMSKTMKLSGAESLAAAANVFLGQTEAPLMVKPYISGMTKSELLCLMTGGMATIAGGVMAAYIGFLGGDDPAQRIFFAKHLLAASVMSAPAAIVAAKMLLPQTQSIDEKLVITKDKIGKNMLEAISIGTLEGLKLAVNVGAMLLVFIAFIAMLNYFLGNVIGNYTGLNGQIAALTGGRYEALSMQFLLGYICSPLSWLMGVCSEDMVLVGQLLGEKTILNEFVAYASLGEMQFSSLFREEKSIIIATYILCGFANFASIGIQIGGIGSLAPDKRTALSELGFRALLGGTMASLLTAVIVGMLI